MNAGRELDAIVAEKIMGWKSPGQPPYDDPGYRPHPLDYFHAGYPHYSTDISDAWQIVEHLKHRSFMIRNLIFHNSTKWHADFHYCCDHTGYEKDFHSDSAAHAICIAALRGTK